MSLSYNDAVSTFLLPPQPREPQLIPKGSIDILASKVVLNNQSYEISSRSRGGQSSHRRQFVSGGREEVAFPPDQHVVKVQGSAADSTYGRTSSQERIIHPKSFGTAAWDGDLDAMDAGRVGISKTVEFEVEVSELRIQARSPSG